MEAATKETPVSAGGHRVHFFDNEESLAGAVADHLAPGVANGESAVVFATPDHRELIRAVLAAAGIDVAGAVDGGRLLLRDAAEMLARLTGGGSVDAVAFDEVVGGIVREAVARGRPIRAYGEMVALQWEAGDVIGAMDLERLWSRLGATLPFSLLCAYPSHLFGEPSAAEAFPEVCHLHSAVTGGAPAAAGSEVAHRFPASARTPRLARNFVAATLEGWDQAALADDALLAVTELTTNAVVHAMSDVFVGLSRSVEGVRLVVGDRSTAPPVPGRNSPTALGGRGLRMIEQIAGHWGHETVDGGKLVWVDLGPSAGNGNGAPSGNGNRPSAGRGEA